MRVTKPKIPIQIQQGYETLEAEKTKFLLASENQRVLAKEAETEHMRATLSAQQRLEVSAIAKRQELAETQAQVRRLELDDNMHLMHQRALADAVFYHVRDLNGLHSSFPD